MSRQGNDLKQAARDQMLRWGVSEELEHHLRTAKESRRMPESVGPHITVSRQEGTGGDAIVQCVARKLGWDVLDKEILDFMADRKGLPRSMLDAVDETGANWVLDIFGTWFDPHVISHEKYLVHLERILWLAALHGRVILVGRGAQFVLPREHGLAVRIVAPADYRIDRLAEAQEISKKESRRFMESVERSRREFVLQRFRRDLDDATLYDVIVNVERYGIEGAAQQIVQSYELMNVAD